MNKLDTTKLGKQPIYLDDYRFVESANFKGFSSIFDILTNATNRILYGCALTNNGGGHWDITAGAIVIDKEVLEVSAESFTCSNIADCYFLLKGTDLPEGLRIFGNGDSHFVYKQRTAQIVETGSPTSSHLDISSATVQSVFLDLFYKKTAFNKNFGMSADTVAVGNHTHYNEYLSGGQVILNTTVFEDNSLGNSYLFIKKLSNDITFVHGYVITKPTGATANEHLLVDMSLSKSTGSASHGLIVTRGTGELYRIKTKNSDKKIYINRVDGGIIETSQVFDIGFYMF